MSEYRNLYQRTFSHLEVSPALREELSAMTEKMEKAKRPKKFLLRRMAVTSMIMALAVVLAMGANAATGGELYEATIGKLIGYAIDSEGNRLNVYKADENSGEAHYVVEAEGGYGGRTETVVIAEDESGPEIGVEMDGEKITQPIEKVTEGTGAIVSLPDENGDTALLNIPWLYDPETGIDGYRQREDGRYDVVVQDEKDDKLKIIVTDEIPFFIHPSSSQE